MNFALGDRTYRLRALDQGSLPERTVNSLFSLGASCEGAL